MTITLLAKPPRKTKNGILEYRVFTIFYGTIWGICGTLNASTSQICVVRHSIFTVSQSFAEQWTPWNSVTTSCSDKANRTTMYSKTLNNIFGHLVLGSSFLLDQEEFFTICITDIRLTLLPFLPCRKDDIKGQIVQTALKTISDYFVTVMASSLRQIKFVMTKMEDIGVYTIEMAKLDAWGFKLMYSIYTRVFPRKRFLTYT